MTVYGYARVSTRSQARDGNSLEEQHSKLVLNGAEIIYSDSFTGTTTERPELTKLLNTIHPHDTLVVTKLDRIARSVTQGISLIDSLIEKDITVNILNMGVMDSTPTGKLIRTIMFAFAEFERDMIVQRTTEGKEIARQSPDYKEGRPSLESRISHETFVELYRNEYVTHHMTAQQCAEHLGISRRSFYKYAKQFINKEKNVMVIS